MRKKFLRILTAAILTAAMLVSVCSCGKSEQTPTDTTTAATDVMTNVTTTTTAPAAEPGTPAAVEGDPIVLTEEHVLVCSNNQSDAMLILANTLKTKIKAKTGLSLSMGYATSPKEKEIVLGYLEDRSACAPAYKTIGGGDYTV